jgi:hypothetical protein
MILVRIGRLLTVSGTYVAFDDVWRGRLEGSNVFDLQDELRESEFLMQGIISWDVIQEIHEPVHFNAFLLECRKEKSRLGLVINRNTHGLQMEIVAFQIGTKGTDRCCFLNVRWGWHLVIELKFCLLEQGMSTCICSHAAKTVQNVLLIKDLNRFIIDIKHSCMIETQGKVIIHFEDDVRTMILRPHSMIR